MAEVLVRPTQHRTDASASELAGSVAECLILAVAPSTGRFRPAVTTPGSVREGELLGHVVGGKGRADVVDAPVDARLHALLVRPGQLVRAGEALAWLERAA